MARSRVLVASSQFTDEFQKPVEPVGDITALIEQFLAQHDVGNSSRGTYRNALKQFFRWITRNKIKQPTRETIIIYKEWLDKKGLRPFTRSCYLVAVRKFFEWAEGLKLYPNIAKGVKGSRRAFKNHQKDALSIEQVKMLFASIDTSTLTGKRDFALINLLTRTGLRLIEIVRADVGDLTEEGDEALLWIRGKGRDGKDDFVVLTADTLNPILHYIRAREDMRATAPLFASLSDRNNGQRLTTYSLSRLVKKYLRGVGLNTRRVSAHSLRHTFGVLAIKAGASLYDVQLAMRHTSPSTTELYLGDIERAKRREAAPERKITALLNDE